jgi:hypothetical protein
VATTLIPILSTILFDENLKPKSFSALAGLISIYALWFVVPVWMVIYAWKNENLFTSQNEKQKKV